MSDNNKSLVCVLMGSKSDWEIMKQAVDTLKEFSIACEARVLSAHRTPAQVMDYIHHSEQNGARIFIAGAGAAAHLAGVIASHTTLPVLAVPIDSSPLQGLDALLATVQMPGGIPVATLAIGKAGAKNAALLAVSILALQDQRLDSELKKYRQQMATKVLAEKLDY